MKRLNAILASDPKLSVRLAKEASDRVYEIVYAATAKPLNRYNIKEGRIFGRMQDKDRYKIVGISGNTVIYKNLNTFKVEYENIDSLVEVWNSKGIVEISPIDTILSKLKQFLEPFLGKALVAALVAWIINKVK